VALLLLVIELLCCCLLSLMFNKAVAIVVAMDNEVLHWHCMFSFAVSCCCQIHR